jgi:hypothetical protein
MDHPTTLVCQGMIGLTLHRVAAVVAADNNVNIVASRRQAPAPSQAASRYSWMCPRMKSVRRMSAGSGLLIGAPVSVTSEWHR